MHSISFGYSNRTPLFKSVDMILPAGIVPGNVTAVMGPSGSGKSTLLKLLLGLFQPSEGEVVREPSDLVVSYVPQEPVLFEHLSIERNARYLAFAGLHRDRFEERLYTELLHDLDLSEIVSAKRPVTELSGGQRQRLSLLRALSVRPDVLLLDEPAVGLDSDVKRKFLILVRRLSVRHGISTLYVTHHFNEAMIVADDIAYLIKESGNRYISGIHSCNMKAFQAAPPTLESAIALQFPMRTVLPVLRIAGAQYRIGQGGSADKTGPWHALAGTEAIRFDPQSAIRVSVKAESASSLTLSNPLLDLDLSLPRHLFPDSVLPEESIGISIDGDIDIYDGAGLHFETTRTRLHNPNP